MDLGRRTLLCLGPIGLCANGIAIGPRALISFLAWRPSDGIATFCAGSRPHENMPMLLLWSAFCHNQICDYANTRVA